MADLFLDLKPKVISIVSTQSGIGKTTLIEKLVSIFKEKGLKVGVLKHDAHKFEMDKKGKDSYRFAQAGADSVVVASQAKLALIQKLEEEKTIEEILPLFEGIDLVIIEGFKGNQYPKIEVHRQACNKDLLLKTSALHRETIVAVASTDQLVIDRPLLDLNKPESISDFIVSIFSIEIKGSVFHA